jgi:N-formylglutamate deformylase
VRRALRLPFVISIPHCSLLIPDHIRPSIALTERQILECADMGTREIFTQFPVRVALWARWSRLVVDLNRSSLRRDPNGVVPEVDYYKRKIYKQNFSPDEEEVQTRLRDYYWPYHHRLKEAIQDCEIKVLFDCHSLASIGPPGAPDRLKWRKDIVLGNNGDHKGETNPSLGTITCPAETLLMMKEVFSRSGFSVSINRPYPGGFITTHYGTELARKGKMAVQIEVNEGLYLDNANLRLHMDKMADASKRLHQAFREIAGRL